MNRLIWYLRQLLPLHYRTTYIEAGRRHYAVWRMWFGRVFDHDDVIVADAADLETAWGIIANAGGGDWSRETSVWRDAAARWRDSTHGARARSES